MRHSYPNLHFTSTNWLDYKIKGGKKGDLDGVRNQEIPLALYFHPRIKPIPLPIWATQCIIQLAVIFLITLTINTDI